VFHPRFIRGPIRLSCDSSSSWLPACRSLPHPLPDTGDNKWPQDVFLHRFYSVPTWLLLRSYWRSARILLTSYLAKPQENRRKREFQILKKKCRARTPKKVRAKAQRRTEDDRNMADRKMPEKRLPLVAYFSRHFSVKFLCELCAFARGLFDAAHRPHPRRSQSARSVNSGTR
jgi:hypothetical protein